MARDESNVSSQIIETIIYQISWKGDSRLQREARVFHIYHTIVTNVKIYILIFL